MRALITGGNGFIGANFICRYQHCFKEILNLDSLSYAANKDLHSLLAAEINYSFIRGSITDEDLLASIFDGNNIDCVINFAAETHVDRSIDSPDEFVDVNIVGTYKLLKQANLFFEKSENRKFRFLHISTDEVYGSLQSDEPAFEEQSKLAPNNPYSASKASAEMLCRSFTKTFNLPILIVNCSNNYGPMQNSEKFIPTVIENALCGNRIPVYGNGQQIRDWLFVEDNCDAIYEVLKNGQSGDKYNIGGASQIKNIDLVRSLCVLLDKVCPKKTGSYIDQIAHVEDRLAHDFRYDTNFSKIKQELGWFPKTSLEDGLNKTIAWFINS